MKTEKLSYAQWQIIEKYLTAPNRNRKHSLREIWDAIFYLLRTGCQWRMQPEGYPKWELVYYYFSNWRDTPRWCTRAACTPHANHDDLVKPQVLHFSSSHV